MKSTSQIATENKLAANDLKSKLKNCLKNKNKEEKSRKEVLI